MAQSTPVVYVVAVNALRTTGSLTVISALIGAIGCQQGGAPDTEPVAQDPQAAAEASPVAVLHPRPKVKVRTKPKPKGPLNVIMITIDALRSDMPWNGYKRDIAPNLTRFAKRAVRFSNHRANTSFTAQSVPTLLTGRLASSLYRSGYFFAAYAPANRFITEDLSAAGDRTIGLHAHMYFNRGKGLDQGFSTWETVKGISYNEKTDEHVTSGKLTDRLIEVLSDKKQAKRRFFAWTHYMDPHHVYTKHKESPDFGNKPRDIYDNEVHFTDRHLGRLFSFIDKQPWADRTAVVVTRRSRRGVWRTRHESTRSRAVGSVGQSSDAG